MLDKLPVLDRKEVIGLADVRLQESDSLENALRRFKRKVQAEDIIRDVKRHSYHLKPGEKLRVKQALARKLRARSFAKSTIERGFFWTIARGLDCSPLKLQSDWAINEYQYANV
jgi:small subunit ribosomal protein S21